MLVDSSWIAFGVVTQIPANFIKSPLLTFYGFTSYRRVGLKWVIFIKIVLEETFEFKNFSLSISNGFYEGDFYSYVGFLHKIV